MAAPTDTLKQENVDLDALVKRYLTGDHQAFDQLIQHTEASLRLFVYSRCRPGEDADEIVNATYVSMFDALPRYQARGAFVSWLMGHANNHLHAYRRDRRRHSGGALADVLDQLWIDQFSDDEEAFQTLCEKLNHCLEQLDQRGQDLMRRHHVEGESLNQLAQRYRRPRQAIAQALFTLRKKLRTCIGNAWNPDAAL